MSKLNGRKQRALQSLAAALTECFDAASESAAERVKTEMGARLDKQDATLRMIWTQCGGKVSQHLPIDD